MVYWAPHTPPGNGLTIDLLVSAAMNTDAPLRPRRRPVRRPLGEGPLAEAGVREGEAPQPEGRHADRKSAQRRQHALLE